MNTMEDVKYIQGLENRLKTLEEKIESIMENSLKITPAPYEKSLKDLWDEENGKRYYGMSEVEGGLEEQDAKNKEKNDFIDKKYEESREEYRKIGVKIPQLKDIDTVFGIKVNNKPSVKEDKKKEILDRIYPHWRLAERDGNKTDEDVIWLSDKLDELIK